MSTGKVLLGLLAGVAAGATLGILFAPEKGSTTRRKITQKGDDYMDGLTDKFNEFIDDVTQKFESVKGKATRVVENGKAKMDEVEAKVIAASKH